jgi:protein-disulfide isomerase
MKRYLPLVIIATVLLVAVAAGALLYNRTAPVPVKSSPRPPVPAAAIGRGAEPPHVHGPESAPVTLEEFGDFECPPCGLLHPELKEIEKEFGDRLRVIFREFPLAQRHKHAYDAARAAEAAALQGKFWEMHNLLYTKQEEWTLVPDARSLFLTYARSLGLDEDRFSRDMVGQLASTRVALDMRRGQSLDVIGTPTVFINGRQLGPDEMTRDGIRRAIEVALPKQVR